MSSNDGYKSLNSPIKWVGGKSRLRKHIIALLPSHTCYVEPFAGVAWVLFGNPPVMLKLSTIETKSLLHFLELSKSVQKILLPHLNGNLCPELNSTDLQCLTHLN
jgi:DNA adenine methylase